MGNIGTAVTLLDHAQRLDPNGGIAAIAEILTETNEILLDMPWFESNLPTGHQSTIRTGLPEVAWRKLNYGVPQSKSTTQPVIDTCGMLEAFSEVDKDIVEINGNTKEFRLSEDRAFIEAMNQEMAETLFYGDAEVNPEKFTGLAPRYSIKSTDDTKTGYNIIDAGGTGDDNTSIWLVCWGKNTAHGIYPKGSKAGLITEDLGLQTVTDAAGGKYRAYQTHFQWKAGLVVRDWRYIGRIANIDVSELTKNASAGADLIDLIVQLLEWVPNLTTGKPVLYCNKTIRSFLRRQITNKSNVHLNIEQVGGKRVLTFDEAVVRKCDRIINTEARVV